MNPLDDREVNLLLDNFIPLGQVPIYDRGTQQLSFPKTSTRRFNLDSNYVKRIGKSSILLDKQKYNPKYVSFGFFETLSVLIQNDYTLYRKIHDFVYEMDKHISSVIESCTHAAAIFSHRSFGDRLFPHIHQDDERKMPTLSAFFNLTKKAENPKLFFSDTIEENSREMRTGYTDHKTLLVYERKSSQYEIEINDGDVILFDAYKIPHTFTYTDDLWLTLVYDHSNIIDSSKILKKDRHHVCTIFK